jgi:hypothetical protein
MKKNSKSIFIVPINAHNAFSGFMSSILLFTAILVQSCTKQTKEISAEKNTYTLSNLVQPSAKAGQTTLPTISLNVSIANDYTDANGAVQTYKIRNENGQSYSDGIDYVKAVIDQNGTFYFNTNTSKNSLATRFIVYDLSDPLDPTNTYSPAFGRGYYYQYNYIFTTGSSQYGTNPFVPLQNLPAGSSECIYMSGNINGDGVNSIFKYTVRFHATKDDLSTTPTAFATVTRVSDSEWKIEPGSCSTTTSNDVGALWTGDTRNEVFKGYYHLPFSFTLTKK